MLTIPTGAEVLAYLDRPGDEHLVAQASKHAAQAATLVRSYTRGRGFGTGEDQGKCAEDVAAVIVTYAARSLTNPTSAREIDAGSFRASPGSAWSFSLVELIVLNGYRQRAG